MIRRMGSVKDRFGGDDYINVKDRFGGDDYITMSMSLSLSMRASCARQGQSHVSLP